MTNFQSVIVNTLWGLGFGIVALLTAVFSGHAHADDRLGEGRDQDRALRARRQGDVPSLGSAMESSRDKGKVVDVQMNGGKYKMKVIDEEGRLRNVDVDGGSSGNSGRDSSQGNSGRGGGGENEGSGGRGRGRGR